MAKKSREVLESFFGGPMPLPKPSALPNNIYKTFLSLRAYAINPKECRSYTRLDRDLEAKLLIDSPAIVMRFVYYRAEVALVFRKPNKKQ